MVLHRALFTWFIFLIFTIFLCLRLEGRITWNWFLIFLPMWVFDLILLIDAVVNIVIRCKRDTINKFLTTKSNFILFYVLLKIVAQIMICLKAEYASLQLKLWHVLVPVWCLLPLMIVDVGWQLYNSTKPPRFH